MSKKKHRTNLAPGFVPGQVNTQYEWTGKNPEWMGKNPLWMGKNDGGMS